MNREQNLLGMIVPTMDNSFFASLASQVEKYLNGKGCRLILCDSGNSAEREKEYLRMLPELGVSGILCVSGLSALPFDVLPADFPLLWLDRRPDAERPVPWVANDDAAAMEDAAEYLLEKGCKHILLLPGFLAEHQESPRVTGYRKAVEKRGLAWDSAYVLNRRGERSTEAETEDLIRSILQKGLPVDGIITSSDRSAFGAVNALRTVGQYVPEDVRLVSFDNSPYSASSSITALDRNPNLLAERACEIMLDLLAGKTDVPMGTIVPVSLVKRDSTR